MAPMVIGGFAALDAVLFAEVAYALRDYETRRKRKRRARRDDRRQRS